MCMSVRTFFIVSIGHGEPAMMPVRSVDRSNSREARVLELGDEHRRHAVERRAALGLRPPRARRAGRTPRRGRRRTRRASCRRGCRSPCRSSGRTAPARTRGRPPCSASVPAMKWPLLRMLWCESVAPFGNPVVPDVYWMLIGSSNWSSASRAASTVLAAHGRRRRAARPSRPRARAPPRAPGSGRARRRASPT